MQPAPGKAPDRRVLALSTGLGLVQIGVGAWLWQTGVGAPWVVVSVVAQLGLLAAIVRVAGVRAEQAPSDAARLSQADRNKIYAASIRAQTLADAAQEFERARDRAVEAARTKSAFLANTSHELRTPLSAILGFADMIASMFEDPAKRDETAELLAAVRLNANHLLRVVNDILDLSKIEAGKIEIETMPFSPTRLVREIEQLLAPRAIDKGLRFVLELPPRLPEWTLSDPTRMRQILLNLVGNAIKFTDRGAVVLRVSIDREQHPVRIVFEVEDTGIGMDESTVARIFEDFSQGDSSITRRFGGTGLGLAISKRMVKLLEGTIEVTSRSGEGSVFRVAIEHRASDAPMIDPQTVSLREHVQPADDESALRRFRGSVLVAEDTPDARRLIEFHLRRLGIDAEFAENGRVACDMVRSAQERGMPYDLILMDVQMPVMDGAAACAVMREAGHTGPIVAVTAQSAPELDRELATGQFDDHLGKPYRAPDVRTIAAKYLSTD